MASTDVKLFETVCDALGGLEVVCRSDREWSINRLGALAKVGFSSLLWKA
jgi:hypothetical protein